MADIGHKVLCDARGLWIGRFERAGTTPAGRRTFWRCLNSAKELIESVETGSPLPPTPEGAIRRYQRQQIESFAVRWIQGKGCVAGVTLDRILEAESLKTKPQSAPDANNAAVLAESCFV